MVPIVSAVFAIVYINGAFDVQFLSGQMVRQLKMHHLTDFCVAGNG